MVDNGDGLENVGHRVDRDGPEEGPDGDEKSRGRDVSDYESGLRCSCRW